MGNTKGVRIDKWLWAVRIFKTRSLAAEFCKKNRVSINGETVKSSRTLKIGDVVEVRKPPVMYRYKILELIEKRVGAKLVPEYMEDITPEQEIIKLDFMRMDSSGMRDRGVGRPTKKDRRTIDIWKSGYDELE